MSWFTLVSPSLTLTTLAGAASCNDIEICAELACDRQSAIEILLGDAGEWLPLDAGMDLIDADALVLSDLDEPRYFKIESFAETGAAGVSVGLRPDKMARTTVFDIEIGGSPTRPLLQICHAGWNQLDANETVRMRLRERWAGAWAEATARAQQLVECRSAR